MPATVSVNMLTVVHQASNGVTIAFPDVCQTPSPAGPIPIPYPNIAQATDSAQTAKKVSNDGNAICVKDSNFQMSTGDEAGSAGGGVASAKIKGKAEFINFSFDVQIEGKNVPRAMDMMLHNDKNTPPVPVIQGPVIVIAKDQKSTCVICKEDL